MRCDRGNPKTPSVLCFCPELLLSCAPAVGRWSAVCDVTPGRVHTMVMGAKHSCANGGSSTTLGCNERAAAHGGTPHLTPTPATTTH